MMKWRKSKPTIATAICAQCGVVYAPPIPKGESFANLCKPHRDAAFALQYRKDAVTQWAATHWEALEPLSKIARYTATIGGLSGGGGGYAGASGVLSGGGLNRAAQQQHDLMNVFAPGQKL